VEAQEIGNFGSVGGILMDSELEILSKLLIELLVVLFVLSELVEHFKAFLYKSFLDDLHDLVLL